MALVVLLRGVNVGGHKRFRPSVLAGQLTHLDVANIGAAGTFVIRRPVRSVDVRAEFARRLPFEAEIIVCQGRDLVRLLSRDFFADYPLRPGIVRFVSVLSRAPRAAPRPPIDFPATGQWLVRVLARENRFVVGLYRRQIQAIRHLGALDRVFGVPVTTRNWNTVGAMARALEQGTAKGQRPKAKGTR